MNEKKFATKEKLLELQKEEKEHEIEQQIIEADIFEREFIAMETVPTPEIKVKSKPSVTLYDPDESESHIASAMHILEKQNQITDALIRNQNTLSLPNQEIKNFEGKCPTEYNVFITKFQQSIESKCNSDLEKLSFLEQFTDGEARKLVESCAISGTSYAFMKRKSY